MDQVDLETLASGPAGGRRVHCGRAGRSGDVLFQNNVNVRIDHLTGNELTLIRKKCGRSASVDAGDGEMGWGRTMLTKEIVQLVGSVETVFQATFWVFWVASQKAPSTGLVTERPRAVTMNKRVAERAEKARIISAGKDRKDR